MQEQQGRSQNRHFEQGEHIYFLGQLDDPFQLLPVPVLQEGTIADEVSPERPNPIWSVQMLGSKVLQSIGQERTTGRVLRGFTDKTLFKETEIIDILAHGGGLGGFPPEDRATLLAEMVNNPLENYGISEILAEVVASRQRLRTFV